MSSDEKYEICKKCDKLTEDSGDILNPRRCKLCNCVMFFKTKVPGFKCPLGKW